jgi:Mn2+/Fe2+ NRAMP family transporter
MHAARSYSRSVVTTVLGLLGIAFFIVCVIALAAAVTWLVVKVSPMPQARSDEITS